MSRQLTGLAYASLSSAMEAARGSPSESRASKVIFRMVTSGRELGVVKGSEWRDGAHRLAGRVEL